jgi:hypothetical protein
MKVWSFVIVRPEMSAFLAGFGMSTRVMRPYSRSDLGTDAKKVYNYRHSRARRCVENDILFKLAINLLTIYGVLFVW